MGKKWFSRVGSSMTYLVSMYNYFQLTLFLVLIEKFDKKSNFRPDWPELGLIRTE